MSQTPQDTQPQEQTEGLKQYHTPEFREAAASARGFATMLLAAKGLALTVLDLMYRAGVVEAMWSEFQSNPFTTAVTRQERS